jgi:glucose-6-phosphate isomerase
LSGFDVLTRGDVLDSALRARERLIASGIPAALVARDASPWVNRPDRGRFGWLDLPKTSRSLLTQVESLAADARQAGLDHIALIGLGADGLAAQAIVDAGGPDRQIELTLLDGGDAAALNQTLKRLERTLVILSSKSGTSIEGDAYRRVLVDAFRTHGLTDREIAGRFIAITDHGSALDGFARRSGYRIGLTDPQMPAHFGALGAYGLVPAMLAGADVGVLLDQAAAASSALGGDDDNPGLLLGAILGGGVGYPGGKVARDKVVLREPGGASSALTAWVAQLIATGTGKRGRGILPLDAAGLPARDACPDLHGIAINPPNAGSTDADTSLWAPLGAQFLLWEYATAVAGWLLDVDPFESAGDLIGEAEEDAARMLHQAAGGPLPTERPTFIDAGIEVHAERIHTQLPGRLHGQASGSGRYDLSVALESLLRQVPPTGYLSILTYLSGDFSGRYLAPTLARHIQRPVAYGCGPGFLHGTGSYHKDGPGSGAFLVVTGTAPTDQPVPGRLYTLGTLQLARALADVRALRRRGVPVVRLHLHDPVNGAAQLLEAVRGMR